MRRQPPGPSGLPLFGNARQYARDPFRFLTACGEAYGDVVRFDLGPMETFMLTNPADIETVLAGDPDRFHKLVFGDAIDDLLGDGLLLSDGQRWREQRQIANPAFAPARVTGLDETMVAHAERTLAGWADGDIVDVHGAMARLTVRIIIATMFGVDPDEATVQKVQHNLEPLGQRFEPDPRRVVVPDWAPTRENRRFDRAVAALEDVIDDLLAERRGTADAGPTAVQPEVVDGDSDAAPPMDLLSIPLRARDRGEQADRQLRDELMTMLLAGHDTTALALTYTWYLLSEHPEVAARFHDELDDELDGETPTAASVRDLAVTDRVLTEAMRLYPPVYALFREPQVDVELGGYRVPAGATVMLPQWVVHRSDRWYEDPESFAPDRWTPERRADRHRFAYFPFGGGPRHCIGKVFALLEAKLVLATVGRAYELDYLGDGMDLRGSLTMHPADPVEVRLRAR